MRRATFMVMFICVSWSEESQEFQEQIHQMKTGCTARRGDLPLIFWTHGPYGSHIHVPARD